jgi:hypothetical protein
VSARRRHWSALELKPLTNVQSPGDAGSPDDGSSAVEKRDSVGDVPGGRPIRQANRLNAVDDAIAGQHILVIQAILIGEKGGGPVILRLAENAVGVLALFALMTVCRDRRIHNDQWFRLN